MQYSKYIRCIYPDGLIYAVIIFTAFHILMTKISKECSKMDCVLMYERVFDLSVFWNFSFLLLKDGVSATGCFLLRHFAKRNGVFSLIISHVFHSFSLYISLRLCYRYGLISCIDFPIYIE